MAMLNPIAMARSTQGKREEELSDLTKEILSKKEHLARVRKSQEEELAGEASCPGEWTRCYEKWDMWEDVEVLEDEIYSEEQKQTDFMRRAQSMVGCGSHDRSAERRVAELSLADRLAEMTTFMEQGNNFYDEGQYARATLKYKRALVFFEYCFPETDAEEEQCSRIRLVCLMNSAACFLKLKNYDDGIENCNQALQIDPENVKCLYRRAVMHRHRDNFDEAKIDILAAIELQPTNSTLRQEREKLRSKTKSYIVNRKKMGDKMFQRQDTGSEKREGGKKLLRSRFQAITDSVLGDTSSDKEVLLDDLFVPLNIDTAEAEKLVNSLTGFNFSDATLLRNMNPSQSKVRENLCKTTCLIYMLGGEKKN